MGLVKTRRLMAMHKQERAKAGLKSRQLKVTPPPRTRQHQTKFLRSYCIEGGGLEELDQPSAKDVIMPTKGKTLIG